MYASVYAYPWDVQDETPAAFCASVREHLGADTVTIAASYHAAKLILPHNPRRKVYYPDDGSLYFQPDPAAWHDSPIIPHVAVMAREADPLAALCQEAGRTGLGVIAWTVCLHNTRLGERYPQYAPRNAFGDPAITYLCPSQPAARAYVRCLVGDLARRYPLQGIQLEAAHHLPFVHGFHHEMQQLPVTPALAVLLGLCFCDACLALAQDTGLDGQAVRGYVAREIGQLLEAEGGEHDPRARLEAYWADRLDGELGRYMALRRVSVDALLREVYQAVDGRTKVFLQEASVVGSGDHKPVADLAWQSGLALPPVPGTADGLTILGYFAGLERWIAEMDAYRALLPTGLPVEIGLRPCIPDCASAEELAAKVAYCATMGATGVSFYNYGMMPTRRMAWVRQALGTARSVA